jgi:hypothetical protein
LDYITDHSGESHLFEETSSEDSESPMSSSPIGILHADLEVLSCQICLSLGPYPTVAPPVVLHAGERLSPDHHRRGATSPPSGAHSRISHTGSRTLQQCSKSN